MKKRLVIISIIVTLITVLTFSTAYAISSYQSTHLTATGVITVNNPQSSGGGGGSSAGGLPNSRGITHNDDGIVFEDVSVTSIDGQVSYQIPAGVKALDKNGNPLYNTRVDLFANPPVAAVGENIIALTYDFQPSGATFSPAIPITFNFDTSKLNPNQAVTIVFWDGSSWVKLTDVQVDYSKGVVIGKTTHFTPFTLLAYQKPVVTSTTTTTSVTTKPVITTSTVSTTTTKPAVTSTITATKPASTPPVVSTSPSTTTTTHSESAKAGSYAWVIFVVGGLIILVVVIVYMLRRQHKNS